VWPKSEKDGGGKEQVNNIIRFQKEEKKKEFRFALLPKGNWVRRYANKQTEKGKIKRPLKGKITRMELKKDGAKERECKKIGRESKETSLDREKK